MVLLALLVTGLLSLASTSVRATEQTAAKRAAQANARMGLMVAIGELQRYLGPDVAITARGLSMARDERIQANVGANTPRAWWVGVAHGDPSQNLLGTNQPARWLVSGLEQQGSPTSQIQSPNPFEEPIAMFDSGSLDLNLLTGGQAIEAGKVPILNSSDQAVGAMAWFIDDEGMKAQLAASDPEVWNEGSNEPLGGGVLPGTFDLGELEGMSSLGGVGPENLNRLLSLKELRFLGAPPNVEREKRLGYTVRSRGILCDVRNGGLKKDLTIAFENEQTFNQYLANSSDDPGQYIVVEPERLDTATELLEGGYIHWDMFREFYNIKKYVRDGVLDIVSFNKEGLFEDFETHAFTKGELGPHQMGINPPNTHEGHPYGDYDVFDKGSEAPRYKHSPVIPILSLLQQRAWIEYEPDDPNYNLETNVQLWTSHYNPFNVNLFLYSGGASGQRGAGAGLRVIIFPQIEFTVGNLLTDAEGFHNKRQTHTSVSTMIQAGRSHVFAFESNVEQGDERDGGGFGGNVQNLTLQSVFQDHEFTGSPPSDNVNLEIDFFIDTPSLMHGQNENPGSREVSQVLFTPFAWDPIVKNNRTVTGKQFSEQVNVAQLDENISFAMEMRLRTTREVSNPLRPLMDSNIRAMWSNPRWDSPLDLPVLASYTMDNNLEPPNPVDPSIQLSTVDAPRGYSYLGGGDDPSDGHDRVVLFDIPRRDLVSLGQLQHASAGRFSYEPSYIVGNSYANPRISQESWVESVTDTFSSRPGVQWSIPGQFNLYDASYLVNEALWDRYIFTTIPQVNDNSADSLPAEPTYDFASLLEGEQRLPNPRFLPYEPSGSSFDEETLKDPERGFNINAGHLLVDGSFNVNSTSVDAWEAFLSGTKGLPYAQVDSDGSITGFSTSTEAGVRYPRVASTLGEGRQIANMDENFWTGFRELSADEVRELAIEIVAQIQQRGPSYGLADFVNRRLEEGSNGQSGPLQAAIDATLNDDLGDFGDDSTQPGTQAAGYPGALLQGDILQALSPYMTTRSESFTIRAYGESRNPLTGAVEAQAWCEATMQRMPDPVIDGTNVGTDPLDELAQPSSRFGRRFVMQSFRWLSEEEI